MFNAVILIKISIIMGLGCWIGIACFNNIVDRATNRQLITRMLTMKLITVQDGLGVGLLSRAWKETKNVPYVLWFIVAVQLLLAMTFWLAGIFLMVAIFNTALYPIALTIANIALCGFNCLWLGFLCGGLWYGYWIHMSPVQTTHFILLIVGLLTTFFINFI